MSGLDPQWLQALAYLATIIGVPVAIVTFLAHKRQIERDRDFHAVLTLSESIRVRWEDGWDAALERLESGRGSTEDRRQLRLMMNWIDWLGIMISERLIPRPEIVLHSLDHAMLRAIRLHLHLDDEGPARLDRDLWRGVGQVYDRLGASRRAHLQPLLDRIRVGA
ncbi:MAG: hypothetical protein R3323_02805 [Wenzhouxiangellaceae bacterium]|nr:hypothetical protein [Wenzhouxiangellaceae bacterium]